MVRVLLFSKTGVTETTVSNSNYLSQLQTLVDGNLTIYPVRFTLEGLTLMVNDDGLLRKLPVNKYLKKLGIHVHGAAILVNEDLEEGKIISVPSSITSNNWLEFLVKSK